MISLQSKMGAACKACTRNDFELVVGQPAMLNKMKRCREIGSLLNSPSLFEHTEEERKTLREEYDRLKRSLPMFVFQATFPCGRRLQSDARLNGLFMSDYDHLDVEKTLAMWASIFGLDSSDRQSLWQRLYEELGILLVHITPSGWGLRVVAKARMEGDISQNQQWQGEALGMQPDEACKDASRVSFAVSQNEILYLNPELFDYENTAYEEKYGAYYRSGRTEKVAPAVAKETVEAGSVAATTAPKPKGAKTADVPMYNGIPYADIIAEWWRQHSGEPQMGERNVKLQKLASNLRYICDNDPEMVLRVMPTYGLGEEEMQALVKRACEYKFYPNLPKGLQAVLDKLQELDLPDGLPSEELYSRYTDLFGKRLKGLKLPPVLKAVVGGVDPSLRIGALLASLPMFFTLLSRVRFRHYDGAETRLSGMTFIVGPAASGKRFIVELDKILMERLREEDNRQREVEENYRRSKEMNKNSTAQPKKPTTCIRIVPSQASNTKLAERMRNAVDPASGMNLHCYTLETELATVIRTAKSGAWAERSDLFCKSFHNELWGMDYCNPDAVNGEVQVNLNLVISGTEDAFDKFIPTGAILSGLPTRIMYFPMPEVRFKMLDLKTTQRSPAQEAELREAAHKLATAGGWVEAQPLTRAMYKWCARMANRARLEDDAELDDLRKRTSLIGVRAGVVYAILQNWRQYATKGVISIGSDAIKFAEFVADYCLTMQYAKFALRMKEQKRRAREYAGARQDITKNAEVYERLEKSFTSGVKPSAKRL